MKKIKKIENNIIKDIRNLFRLKKDKETIKNRVIRDIRNFSEHDEEDYYKAVRVGNFRSNNYIEYESNADRNKTLEEYPNRFRPYLKDMINGLKKFLIDGKFS